MKKALAAVMTVAAMAVAQAAVAEGVPGEKQDSGLGTMVYGESLDSGLGQLTAADLQVYMAASAER